MDRSELKQTKWTQFIELKYTKMDQNRSNGSKWTKLTKWIEFDQSGLKQTELDRNRPNGPKQSKWTK